MWKTKTFFKKLKYRFLVESTKIENASFPYQTAISEANDKTNKIVTTKELSFASNYLFFWKFCFNLRTLKKSSFVVTTTQMPIFVISASAGVSFDGAFPLSVSLKKFDLQLFHLDFKLSTVWTTCFLLHLLHVGR